MGDNAPGLTGGFRSFGAPELQLAAGVTIVGQEGVELDYALHGGVQVGEGARLESVHFPRGVTVVSGSVTMEKCTSTGAAIMVCAAPGGGTGAASLVMEDCRSFGSGGYGISCHGKMTATRCIFEDNRTDGLHVANKGGEAKLIKCMLRNNGRHGLYVEEGEEFMGADSGFDGGKLTLVGGTVSGNKGHGVLAGALSKVTVTAAERSEEMGSVAVTVTVLRKPRGLDFAPASAVELVPTSMKVAELKSALAERGLDATGKKAELATLLVAALTTPQTTSMRNGGHNWAVHGLRGEDQQRYRRSQIVGLSEGIQVPWVPWNRLSSEV